MTSEWRQWEEALRADVEPWEHERAQDASERMDALSRDVSFGTGGIRALMGIGPNRLNRLTVSRASAGLAAYLLQECEHRPTVVVAYDTRRHSRDFARVAAGTFAAAGLKTRIFEEPCGTPVLSFAVPALKADAGVVITASHNPMEYNGYKVYGSTGDQATDELAHAVQASIQKIDPFLVEVESFDDALARDVVEWVDASVYDEYIQEVLAQSTGVDCTGISVVYSPLNGCGIESARAVFGRRGIRHEYVREQCEPDGTFATCPKPNPELAEAMERAMGQALRVGADLALANDPDADRIGVAVRHDDSMRLLTGDEVGLLLLDFLCRVCKLPAHPVAVTTVVSSPLLDAIAHDAGVELRRTLTGFKYIGEQINLLEAAHRSDDFVVGVEESCGYLRGTYLRDKDGIVALMLACEMCAWYKLQGMDLIEALEALYTRYGYMVSRQVSIELAGLEGRRAIEDLMSRLRDKPPTSFAGLDVEEIHDYRQGSPMPGDHTQILPPANVIQFDLVDDCRLIVRPSGTEPKVKAYCFAKDFTRGEALNRLACMEVDARALAHG